MSTNQYQEMRNRQQAEINAFPMNIIIEQFDSGEHWVSGNDALPGFVFYLVDRTILSLNDSLSRLSMQNLGFNQLLVRKADMIQAASFLLAVLHQPHHLL